MNLPNLRTILALLITLSLAVAPLGSAWAAVQSHGSPSAEQQQRTVLLEHSATSDAENSADMTDCMKMMLAAGDKTTTTKGNGSCKCCDTQYKCADTANCMTKCYKVLGAIKPAGKFAALARIAYRPAEPAKPPEWLRTPPAPPPRT